MNAPVGPPQVTALQFPRACLPLSYVIVELQQMLLSMAVLFGIVLATGEPVTWYWPLAAARPAAADRVQPRGRPRHGPAGRPGA